jgi:hypothetical protein
VVDTIFDLADYIGGLRWFAHSPANSARELNSRTSYSKKILSMGKYIFLLFVACMAIAPSVASASGTSANARQLVALLDSMKVEQLWPAGEHVNWETGVPDGKPERSDGKHTHCSAFVASVAKHLGIYILRPPEHAQILLANAQYEWLADQGAKQGWNALSGGEQAQIYANRGYLVVATYRNHHDDKPGHIAIVRPSEKSTHLIEEEGPQITQAGGTNYTSTSLKRGFAGHPAAWTHSEVRYYAHSIDWQHVAATK